jgi:hypothetical protein
LSDLPPLSPGQRLALAIAVFAFVMITTALMVDQLYQEE